MRVAPGPWQWSGRRVLLEQPFDDGTQGRVDALRRAGYAVTVCAGPGAGDRCPLVGDEGCAAAEGADVVVSALDQHMPEAQEVLRAMGHRLPQRPVIVLTEPVTPDELVARVQAVVDA